MHYHVPEKLNADLSKPAVVHSNNLPWTPSQTPGVERRFLEALGELDARALVAHERRRLRRGGGQSQCRGEAESSREALGKHGFSPSARILRRPGAGNPLLRTTLDLRWVSLPGPGPAGGEARLTKELGETVTTARSRPAAVTWPRVSESRPAVRPWR